jgi:putative transposase
MELQRKSASHAVFSIRLHIVFVTKYRRPVLNDEMIADLKEAFAHILSEWRCTLLEFGAEADHAHLLIDIHPALNLSALINNLKSASSKRVRGKHWNWLRHFYGKPGLWHRAYYAGSVGNVSLETVKRYVQSQGKDMRRKASSRTPPA